MQSRHGVGGRSTPHTGSSASAQPPADGHTDRRLPQLKTLQEQTQIPGTKIVCLENRYLIKLCIYIVLKAACQYLEALVLSAKYCILIHVACGVVLV